MWSASGVGYEQGLRSNRLSVWIDQVFEKVERTVAPSCVAWFPIVVVGLGWGEIFLLWVMLFQVARGAEASAVRGRRWWWTAKETESGGNAMARGHEGSA